MKTTYIQFEAPKSDNQTSKESWLKKTFVNILTKIIPKANPDFDNKIDEVKWWLVEFETGVPQRELGLDIEGKMIMKMPYKKNYGFWTDNNLLLDDFKKHLNVKEIDKTNFEAMWSSFQMKQDFDFFKIKMPYSRKADFQLGCCCGSVYIDFNQSSDGLISLSRISFDGYGCCDITGSTNFLNSEVSKKFIEEITKGELDQEKLTPLVKEIIKINQEYIWTDALEEYNLLGE